MRILTLGFLVLLVTACLASLTAQGLPSPRPSPQRLLSPAAGASLSLSESTAVVAQYCVSCHSERGKAGGLTLAGFDASKAEADVEIAEKMIRKLRVGMMPPPGAKRPDPATLLGLVTALEAHVDKAAALNPNPGTASFPASQPGRVCALDSRSARARHRCIDISSSRHGERRLR